MTGEYSWGRRPKPCRATWEQSEWAVGGKSSVKRVGCPWFQAEDGTGLLRNSMDWWGTDTAVQEKQGLSPLPLIGGGV